jgi:hypothetical protein
MATSYRQRPSSSSKKSSNVNSKKKKKKKKEQARLEVVPFAITPAQAKRAFGLWWRDQKATDDDISAGREVKTDKQIDSITPTFAPFLEYSVRVTFTQHLEQRVKKQSRGGGRSRRRDDGERVVTVTDTLKYQTYAGFSYRAMMTDVLTLSSSSLTRLAVPFQGSKHLWLGDGFDDYVDVDEFGLSAHDGLSHASPFIINKFTKSSTEWRRHVESCVDHCTAEDSGDFTVNVLSVRRVFLPTYICAYTHRHGVQWRVFVNGVTGDASGIDQVDVIQHARSLVRKHTAMSAALGTMWYGALSSPYHGHATVSFTRYLANIPLVRVAVAAYLMYVSSSSLLRGYESIYRQRSSWKEHSEYLKRVRDGSSGEQHHDGHVTMTLTHGDVNDLETLSEYAYTHWRVRRTYYQKRELFEHTLRSKARHAWSTSSSSSSSKARQQQSWQERWSAQYQHQHQHHHHQHHHDHQHNHRQQQQHQRTQQQQQKTSRQSSSSTSDDYYHILGVSRTATVDEIKKAFRRQIFKYHPDYTSADASDEQRRINEDNTQKIIEAYHTLRDVKKRIVYDRTHR